MGKVKALRTLFSKLTKKQRDLRNARSRLTAARRRSRQGSGDLTRKQHVSKRMKELIKQGKMDDIVKEAKKGTGYYAGKSKPGSGVGRWEYK